MADKLKVGIVGCGAIAGIRHIPAFMKLKRYVTLQAVCDKNESLANNTAKKYAIPKAYSDLSQMLSKEKLNIVDICTPPQVHAPLAIEAMEHGCHVLLEKPMALKTSDCDEMINVSCNHKVSLCIAHNQLFYPPFLRARKLVADGAIGDFIGMRIFISDPRDEMIMRNDYWIHELPGGLIGETAPHAVYESLAFLNQVRDVEICAKNFLDHPWAPFDEFRIELEGEKAVSSITVSYASNRRATSIDLLGTEGAMHLDLLSMLLIHQGKNQSMKPIPLARYSLGIASQVIAGIAQNAFSVLTTGKGKFFGHDVIIERFVDSILNNSQPPVTGEEGKETVKVMEMIIEGLYEKYGDGGGGKA